MPEPGLPVPHHEQDAAEGASQDPPGDQLQVRPLPLHQPHPGGFPQGNITEFTVGYLLVGKISVVVPGLSISQQ